MQRLKVKCVRISPDFGTPIIWVSLTRAVGGVLKKLGCHDNLWDLDRAQELLQGDDKT